MPRDDLTIAAHFPNMPPGMPDAMGSQALDPLTVLEDFISRSANLPAEIAYMREEMEGYRGLSVVEGKVSDIVVDKTVEGEEGP